MLLLYFYSILGFTNLYSITENKKQFDSTIEIPDYSYTILYDIYSLFLFLLLLFSFVYDMLYNISVNTGYILYKLNCIKLY